MIRVLIVDDSAVVRQVLKGVLEADPLISVIAAVADPLLAIKRMKAEWPQVIVLDLEVPRMDGLSFLRKIMAERPTPTVICSGQKARESRVAVAAMAAGAVAVVHKPELGIKEFQLNGAPKLVAAVRAAAQARLRHPRHRPLSTPPDPRQTRHPQSVQTPPSNRARPRHSTLPLQAPLKTKDLVIAIGASTGGTQALEELLSALPANGPAIVVVQHMPPKFTEAFAARLNSICQITVQEAKHQQPVRSGQALIAPGGRHMLLCRSSTGFAVELDDGPPVKRHRPSVDVLFRSVAKSAGAQAIGVIMTGMGSDGALGLLDMRKAGAWTLAQDEASCVVYGMPKEAVACGAVYQSLPLLSLAPALLQRSLCTPPHRHTRAPK